uniref:Uncharacterized protein LOC114337028 n=1 Tax=Diabrotica virgifera virgifera TaxID=50390 RepID=A0A6P7GE45_DIAVI
MSTRPSSGSKLPTGHRRSESSGHHRHSSGSSFNQNKSDSGQSINSDYHGHQKHGHHRSKSSVVEREVEKEQTATPRYVPLILPLCVFWWLKNLYLLHKDKFGKPKRLNQEQLESIRLNGVFEVESLNFPGQKHKWKLSQLLQKGLLNSHDSLLNDLALAVRFIVVTAKGRLVSHFFSLSQAARGLLTGFLRIVDVLIGIPSLQAHNLESKLREERNKYLVAELVCRPENEDSLEVLCSFIRKQLRRAATEKFEVTRECSQPPVSVPYKFLTPSGSELDLRLWDRSLMRKLLPILVSILERETRGWFLHFRERLIAELRTQKMPDEDIEREVNEAVMKEYLQRVYNSILAHPDIMALGEDFGQLLVQQAQSVVLMHRAVENVQHRLYKSQEEVKIRLCSTHPVLSRIGPWLRAKLRAAEQKFSQENQWSAHEEALMLCNSQRLLQTVYFLNRDLTFMKEREPALLRELRKDKIPTRSFLWPTQIWLPKNWIIRRNFQGQSEVVPTVLSKQATSITTPRSDPSQPVFLVEKETIRTTTTRWPIWRIFNYFHRTWCWTWNAMFFFGIVLPWCSPVGLRALFCLEPFMADLELSQVNGTLFPRKSSLTPTLMSRLLSLWRHISKSRTHFETKPDTGFIGKGLTRHLNRIWNYFIKGLFGTVLIVVIFPIACFIVTFASLFVALTCVLWMPALTLAVQVTNLLIYDLDSPEQQRNRFFVILEAVLWNISFQGCLQPLLALFVAVVVCPVISLTILAAGSLLAAFHCSDFMLIFQISIQQGALMLERFYPKQIIPKLGCTEDQFWDSRALSPGDWAGLAGLLYSELFSLDFLTPLDHTDTSFRLDSHSQVDLSRYTDMVQCAQLGAGGPDLLGNVYTPRGNIQVHSPYLDVSAFNPRSKLTATGKKAEKAEDTSAALGSLKTNCRATLWMPWKKHSRPFSPDKMMIPLPIPHPAHIAVTIYNRDSDDPIPLESDLCQSILRGIEESHVSPDDSGIGRFKGGADSFGGTTSSSSNTLDSQPIEESTNESTDGVYRWTLSNWGGGRKRQNSGSVRVDLASPEDVTLDSDSTRVVFCTYGTTV